MFMKSATRLVAACSLFALVPGIAHAQAVSAEEAAVLRAEVEALKAQLSAMEARLESLSARTEANSTAIAAVPAPAPAPETTVKWKGAPELEGKGGWSFKVRGRLQVDSANVDAPDGISADGLGFTTEVRRARLGVEGDMPGGFGYKFEADFADNGVEIADAILSYTDKDISVAVGQHNNFQSLEELTSSRFSSFMERAAFTDAFNFERRVGLSATVKSGDALLSGGVFTDNIEDLSDDRNNSYGFDARGVWAPRFGDTQLHLGGSVHWRDFNDAATTARYRQRPFVHGSDVRFIDTGAVNADGELSYGLEAAMIRGPLHLAGETHWLRTRRPGVSNSGFFGGYAEVGYFLTSGDSRGYKNGIFDRVKPSQPIGKGGIGAIQLNLRYDYLDLVDAGVVGGTQNGYAASLIWTPIDYVRFMINYGHMEYDRAAITANGEGSYSADVVGARAQIDF